MTGFGPDAIAITPATATQKPVFTSDSSTTAAFGVPFTFTVTTTGDPAPKITKTGSLPPGVRFTNNGDGTATISGTPRKSSAGPYPLTLTATNKAGTATLAFTLIVTKAPAIRNIRTIKVRVGAALGRIIRATGFPIPALTESGQLPGGLSFTDHGNGAAAISGAVVTGPSGRYTITITAKNSAGTTMRRLLIIVVRRRGR
jgi:PKD repeat protein